MGKKKKEQVVEEAPKPDVKTFDYGDLTVACKCGRSQIIHKGIEKGIQLVLTTSDNSFIQLMCDECGAELKLYLQEGEAPQAPEIEVKEQESETVVTYSKKDEDVQEADKQESSI